MENVKLAVLATIFMIILTGCGQAAQIKEIERVSIIETSVAQTLTALPSPTLLPTNTDLPTNTPTSTETPTLVPSSTSQPTPSLTATVLGGSVSGNQTNLCDSSRFISDINIPDGTRFAPGTKFFKTWRVQNNGTCTWPDGYAVFFLSGSKLDGVSPQKLTVSNIKPGDSIDISVELVAPTQPGSYISYWKLQNASSTGFGEVFYVQIQVSTDALPSPSVTLGTTSTPSTTPTVTATLEPSATTETP